MILEVGNIRALNGQFQLTELDGQSVAHAAKAAGIDIIVSGHRTSFAARHA